MEEEPDTAKEDKQDYEITTKHLKISKNRREVLFDKQPVTNLTPKEFDLLYTMAQKLSKSFLVNNY